MPWMMQWWFPSPCHRSLHLSQDGVNHNMLVLLNKFRNGL
ncbi:hypothetical protein J3E64_001431 [Sphingobium sp. OAS761]|nr:hypothetical protein [Sphingobium sp. OAS761]